MNTPRNYPEDIQIGDLLFRSRVTHISDRNPENTYLTIFSFLLEDGRTIEFFSDEDISHLNIQAS